MKRDRLSRRDQHRLLADYLKSLEEDVDYLNTEAATEQTNAIISSGGLTSARVYCGVDQCVKLNMKGTGVLAYHPNTTGMVWMLIYVNWCDEYVLDMVCITEVGESHQGMAIQNRNKKYGVKNIYSVECFFDNLKEVFERSYDSYIKEHEYGFIPIAG